MWHTGLTCHLRHWHSMLECWLQFQIQLLHFDDLSAWAHNCIHLGDVEGVLDFWLQPGPALTIVVICRMNPWLYHSIFQINKIIKKHCVEMVLQELKKK